MTKPARKSRYVFVTPYYKERRELLERCIASAKRQTIRADHILVSDGFPQDWIDQAHVRHLRLDRAHQDHGNTPRGLGIHVPDEPSATHVDTSCFLLLPPSFDTLPVWILMPREVSAVCDRVFYLALRSRNLIPGFSAKRTVNFTYTHAPLYRSLGEAPPEPIKENPDHAAIAGWIDRLPPHRLEMINRRLEVDLRALYRPQADLRAPAMQGRIKARSETMATFCELANINGWSLGETFEHAVAALTAMCKPD